MPQRKHKPEEIVAQLRQVDVLLLQGRPVADVGLPPFGGPGRI
jgi:putative transposase